MQWPNQCSGWRDCDAHMYVDLLERPSMYSPWHKKVAWEKTMVISDVRHCGVDFDHVLDAVESPVCCAIEWKLSRFVVLPPLISSFVATCYATRPQLSVPHTTYIFKSLLILALESLLILALESLLILALESLLISALESLLILTLDIDIKVLFSLKEVAKIAGYWFMYQRVKHLVKIMSKTYVLWKCVTSIK